MGGRGAGKEIDGRGEERRGEDRQEAKGKLGNVIQVLGGSWMRGRGKDGGKGGRGGIGGVRGGKGR